MGRFHCSSLCLSLFLILFAFDTQAQDPLRESIRLWRGDHPVSWDGRVVFQENTFESIYGSNPTGLTQTWALHSAEVGNIVENFPVGYPDPRFLIVGGNSSDPIGLRESIDSLQLGEAYEDDVSYFTVITKDPRVSDNERANPYRCSDGETPNPLGTDECYDIAAYSLALPGGDTSQGHLQVQYLKVQMRAFEDSGEERLLNPFLLNAYYTSDIIKLSALPDDAPRALLEPIPTSSNPSLQDPSLTGGQSDEPNPSSDASGDSSPDNIGEPLFRSLHFTVSADGRFIITGDGQYSVNASEPFDQASWSALKPLSQMPDETAVVQGVPFIDRYPVARSQFRDAQGVPCGGCNVNSPLLSSDGRDLFFTQLEILGDWSEELSSIRGGYSMIGESTNYVATHIDGPLNRRRFYNVGPTRSPGKTMSDYEPYPEFRTNYFPYTQNVSAHMIFTDNEKYGEVSAPEFNDGNYIVALPMNELITDEENAPEGGFQLLNFPEAFPAYGEDAGFYPIPDEKRVSTTLTPDRSGNFNTAFLDGAMFPNEYYRSIDSLPEYHSENTGFASTRGIYFLAGTSLHIPKHADSNINPNAQTGDLQRRFKALTVELAVKPHEIGEAMNLFFHPDMLRVLVTRAGEIMLRLRGRRGMRTFLARNIVVPENEWTHLGVVLDSRKGRGFIYVNGERQARFRIPRGRRFRVGLNNADTKFGPNNMEPRSGGVAVMTLDECAVSKIARTEDYFFQRSSREKGLVAP